MSNLLRIVLLAGSLGCALAAEGVQSDSSTGTSLGLEVVTVSEKRKEESTSTAEFVAADQLHLGDEIFYTVRVRNTTDAPVTNPIVVKAVPRNTRYIADSAVGPAARVEYSVDGGATFGNVDELSIVTNSGQKRATSDDFTHIRWELRHPLAPSATALLRFRGIFK